jgi:peptide/nickel transport system permease protein
VSSFMKIWQKLKRYPLIPGVIIFIFIFLAIFGEALAPYPPNGVSLRERFLPPAWQSGGKTDHLLGTDNLGRDMLSRIMAGARVSSIVALLAITLGGFVGAALGIISGYYGKRVDAIVMRAVDATLAFPIILLAILLCMILGPSLQNVVISLGIVLWARFARVIRGEVLSLKERDFVALARVAGSSGLRIMARHIFPNIWNTLLVMLTLQVGWVIIVEASLSFLGAGIPGPSPVWGSMISKGREYITTAWWIPFLPGLAVSLVCLSFNMFGDWLREVLDPKLRQVGGGA